MREGGAYIREWIGRIRLGRKGRVVVFKIQFKLGAKVEI